MSVRFGRFISNVLWVFKVSEVEQEKRPIWVSEVGDLRQKAAYYGARHLGTHISRDHLGQLIAKNADRWDDPGSPHSDQHVLTDALDLARSSNHTRSRFRQLSTQSSNIELLHNMLFRFQKRL